MKKKRAAKAAEVVAAADLDAGLALQQYRNDPDWMFKTGMGGMLTAAALLLFMLDVQHFFFLPISLAIGAVLCGYLLRSLRLRVQNPDAKKLPDWNEWGDLFMSGITWIMIQFGLGIFVATIISITLIFTFYSLNSPNSMTLWVTESSALAILMVSLAVHFLATFLWVNFAVEERMPAGLAFRKVSARIRKKPLVLWLAWALATGLQAVAIVVPTLTVLGIFIVPSILFGAQLVSTNILAQAWTASED